MDLITKIDIPKYDFKINFKDKTMFIGSCFSENIGEKFLINRMSVLVNPTGIHYNPLSISESLETIINKTSISENELFYCNGLWHHFNFHSKFSKITKEECQNEINNSIKESHSHIKSAKYLFVTFGTAYIFQLKENGQIVSNCHKLKSEIFNHIFIKPDRIVYEWEKLIKKITDFNENLKIIFTVSPIRHIKDGAINNSRSKSSLVLAIKELCENPNYKNLYYFPSYEIVNDELRDYRFFADDMQHISKIGIEYIWEKFQEHLFDNKTKTYINDIQNIVKMMSHKPFNEESEDYQKFEDKRKEKIFEFEKKYEI